MSDAASQLIVSSDRLQSVAPNLTTQLTAIKMARPYNPHRGGLKKGGGGDEEGDERWSKKKKTVWLSDGIRDSPSSVDDIQEEVKGEETIESETKPQKRKAVESSEDSLTSDVDAQKKVEEK